MKKVYRVIIFDQNAWLKSYIIMNRLGKKKAKNDFEKDFFKLINNAVFRMKKMQILMNKPVYLGLSILKLGKILYDVY